MKRIKKTTICIAMSAFCGILFLSGCSNYSHGWPYPDRVQSVYVEMFGSQSFRRGAEYKLTDAVCKQIEVQTPYKIIADRSRADSILYGQILFLDDSILAAEPRTGQSIEKEARIEVVFSWKNLRTGQMYVNEQTVIAAADYVMGQEFTYAESVAVNNAAKRIVEAMRIQW